MYTMVKKKNCKFCRIFSGLVSIRASLYLREAVTMNHCTPKTVLHRTRFIVYSTFRRLFYPYHAVRSTWNVQYIMYKISSPRLKSLLSPFRVCDWWKKKERNLLLRPGVYKSLVGGFSNTIKRLRLKGRSKGVNILLSEACGKYRVARWIFPFFHL